MANLLVKEISTELLAEVNYAARISEKTQREFVIEVLEQATKQQRRAMAVAVEGDAAQKTCAYEPSEGKQSGRGSEPLNTPELTQASTSGLGQAEARRPSARHGAATHRSLAQNAGPDGLSAPSGEVESNPKCPYCDEPLVQHKGKWGCKECNRIIEVKR